MSRGVRDMGLFLPTTDDRPLLRRNVIELRGPLLIKERAFGPVTAAPVLVATWHAQEISRSYALFARIIFVQIRPLENDDRDVVSVRVHARVVPWIEFRPRRMRALVRVSPDRRHRNLSLGHRLVSCALLRSHDAS